MTQTKINRVFGIIPARYGSTRFPGKPLTPILGKPMFWHVFQRARQCPELEQVVLATDSQHIAEAADTHQVPFVMTRPDHPSGTDRVMEAAAKLNLPPDSVVVNIQGDEPALDPAMLAQLVSPFRAADVQVTTLARKISAAEVGNPDLVKVVFAEDGRALYFSRSPIPHPSKEQKINYYGHIGIYAFRMKVLEKFVTLDQSRLEVTERLEQLRLLENNIAIHIVLTNHHTCGVDRPEDIETVSHIIRTNNSATTARKK